MDTFDWQTECKVLRVTEDEVRELAKGMTVLQLNFALNVFKGLRATDAYREAGYKTRTPGATWSAASRLLRNVKVSRLVDWLRQKAVDVTIMDSVEMQQRLSEIGRGRIGDFVSSEGGPARIRVALENLNSGAVQEVTTELVRLGKGEDPITAEVTKLKLHDPIRAIDLLAKLQGLYAGGPTVNIDNRKVENNFVNFDPKEIVRAVVEAIQLGLSPEVLGGAVDGEDAAVLPASADT